MGLQRYKDDDKVGKENSVLYSLAGRSFYASESGDLVKSPSGVKLARQVWSRARVCVCIAREQRNFEYVARSPSFGTDAPSFIPLGNYLALRPTLRSHRFADCCLDQRTKRPGSGNLKHQSSSKYTELSRPLFAAAAMTRGPTKQQQFYHFIRGWTYRDPMAFSPPPDFFPAAEISNYCSSYRCSVSRYHRRVTL